MTEIWSAREQDEQREPAVYKRWKRILPRLDPAGWPLTLKIPLLVVAFMVVVAIAVSDVVLHRLASDQELHLQQLALQKQE